MNIRETVLDLRGEVCPYPYIRTRPLVERMNTGDVLVILTTDRSAVENMAPLQERFGVTMETSRKEGYIEIRLSKR